MSRRPGVVIGSTLLSILPLHAPIQAAPAPDARQVPALLSPGPNDQIHLTGDQKVRLYERPIGALRDDKIQVREIALKALQIQTGQTKNFDPARTPQAREVAITEWTRWLETYRSHL